MCADCFTYSGPVLRPKRPLVVRFSHDALPSVKGSSGSSDGGDMLLMYTALVEMEWRNATGGTVRAAFTGGSYLTLLL